MDKTYWRLEPPQYSSDYQDTFINGSSQHLYGMPGLSCNVCKKTYGGGYPLPYACPEKLQKHKNIRRRWPITEVEHKLLQQQIKDEMPTETAQSANLFPGADFQPLHLKFPSRPQSDFLWSSLGSVVVSPKVKILFERHAITGVQFCPAVIDKVGKRDSTGPVPIASTGEPEDIIDEVEAERNPAEFGPLYEMVIVSTSGRPPGAEIISRCPACGREEFDNSKRVITLTQDMVPPTDIFFLATTLHIVVNDKVREIAWRNRLTNAEFTQFPM